MRRVTRLDGEWRFLADMRNCGVRERWHAPAHPDRDWLRVPVPQAWDRYGYEFRGYEGVAWFRRDFRTGPARGGTALLEFDGAGHRAAVWLNGRPAGTHEGGYNTFQLDISRLIRPGRNLLAVRIEHIFSPETIPPAHTDIWKYGGITRSVRLVANAGPLISRATVLTGGGHRNPELRVLGRVMGRAPGGSLFASSRVRFRPGGAVLAESGAHPVRADGFAFTMPGEGLPRWAPERPRLLWIEFAIADRRGKILDALGKRFGVRTIQWDGGRLRVNGRPVWLRGVNQVEEYPGRTCTGTEAQMRARLRDIRDNLHGNFFRAAHYPHHPRFPGLCDEMGVMLLEEVPLCFAHELEDSTSRARAMADEMFWRDAHHPSILIWSVGNERPVNEPATVRGVVRMVRHMKRLDASRPVTCVSNQPLSDASFPVHDILAVNEYHGVWAEEDVTDVRGLARVRRGLSRTLDELNRRYPDKPVVITEFGAPTLPGGARRFGGGDFQAALIRAHTAVFRRKPFVHGCAAWCYCDQRLGSYQKYPPGYLGTTLLEVFGLKTLHGRPRPAFRALADFYRRMAARRGR